VEVAAKPEEAISALAIGRSARCVSVETRASPAVEPVSSVDVPASEGS